MTRKEQEGKKHGVIQVYCILIHDLNTFVDLSIWWILCLVGIESKHHHSCKVDLGVTEYWQDSWSLVSHCYNYKDLSCLNGVRRDLGIRVS